MKDEFGFKLLPNHRKARRRELADVATADEDANRLTRCVEEEKHPVQWDLGEQMIDERCPVFGNIPFDTGIAIYPEKVH